MSKKNSYRPPVTERIGVPKITRDPQGNAVLNCPFCEPAHPLRAENDAQCGTVLQVRAVQTIFKAKYDNRLVCVKCGQGGGEMARFQNGFVHITDCAPGVKALASIPEFSPFAKRVHDMPPFLKNLFERLYGDVIQVQEVLPNGEKTGTTLGYFFHKRGKNDSTKTGQRNQAVASGG